MTEQSIQPPKISVLMPVYNGEKYLSEAINSVLLQTLTDFEFIIIDDHSTDRTRTIVESFHDARIKIIHNDIQMGVAASLNKGLNQARGKYIARMDADDVNLSFRLQRQFDFMEQHPDIDISGAWVRNINEDDQSKSLTGRIWKQPTNNDEIKALMFFSCPLIHPTVIFRRETFNMQNLRYNESYQSAQDYELWSRAMDNVKFGNMPLVLLEYRTHANSITKTRSAIQQQNSDRIREFISRKYNVPTAPTDTSILAYERWLVAIRDKSDIKKLCSTNALQAVLDKIWFAKCLENASLGLSIVRICLSSELRQNNMKGLIKSFILLFRAL